MIIARLCAAALLASSLAASAAAPDVSRRPRYAYAAIFYEGTPNDAAYLLALRVMMRSIELSGSDLRHAERVAILDPSVRDATAVTLRRDGLRVVRRDAIANPFPRAAQRWRGVFLKLTAWSLDEYDAVLLLDADNVALAPLDALFGCPAALCAVSMQACRFHTGMLLVRPHAAEFRRLRAALAAETRASFDGADQGFLDGIYGKEMRAAPGWGVGFDEPTSNSETQVLSNSKSKSNSNRSEFSLLRLAVGWNLPHTYWLLGALDWSAMRRGRWHDVAYTENIPAASLAFPITPTLKPWHWWSVALLDPHWVWHFYRAQLETPRERAVLLLQIGVRLGIALTCAALLPRFAAMLVALVAVRLKRRRPNKGRPMLLARLLSGGPLGSLVSGLAAIALAALIALVVVPRSAPPLPAWALLLGANVALGQATARAVATLRGGELAPPPRASRAALVCSVACWALLAVGAPVPWATAPPSPQPQARALLTKLAQAASIAGALRAHAQMFAAALLGREEGAERLPPQ